MDAHLAQLVRSNLITQQLAEQRASVPEELKRSLVPSSRPRAGPLVPSSPSCARTDRPPPWGLKG